MRFYRISTSFTSLFDLNRLLSVLLIVNAFLVVLWHQLRYCRCLHSAVLLWQKLLHPLGHTSADCSSRWCFEDLKRTSCWKYQLHGILCILFYIFLIPWHDDYMLSVYSVKKHSIPLAIAIYLLSGAQRGCLSMQERCLGCQVVPACQQVPICTWQQKRIARCFTLSFFWSMFKALQSSAWLASLLLAFYPNGFVTYGHFHFWNRGSRRNDGIRSK